MTAVDLEKMRNYIYSMYPGENWHAKVLLMKPNQVKAIYITMKRRGQKKVKPSKKIEKYRQLNLFDDFGLRLEE